MTITFYKSESGVAPELLDTTSSAYYTYIRKNVQEVEKEDPDGTKRTMFEYDEAKLTKAEYALYRVSEAAGEDNTAAQEAIAELAEIQDQSITELQEAIAELAEIVVGE